MNGISEETVEYISILAKLSLSEEEKAKAKEDMSKILAYMDKLKELDTEGIEPMSQVFPVSNVFREDVIGNGTMQNEILSHAPEQKDGRYVVPKAFD